jgi:hypothetical protein
MLSIFGKIFFSIMNDHDSKLSPKQMLKGTRFDPNGN